MRQMLFLIAVSLGAVPFAVGAQSDDAGVTMRGKLTPIVRDQAIAKALRTSQSQMDQINKTCSTRINAEKKIENPKEQMRACFCEHIDDVARANQVKTEALMTLLNKDPGLKGHPVRVQGISGKVILSDDTLKSGDSAFARKLYRCQ